MSEVKVPGLGTFRTNCKPKPNDITLTIVLRASIQLSLVQLGSEGTAATVDITPMEIDSPLKPKERSDK